MRLVYFLAVAGLSAIPASSLAQQGEGLVSYGHSDESVYERRVSAEDLNLAVKAGVQTFDRRIESAVKEVCADPGADRWYQAQKCHDEAWLRVAPSRAALVEAARERMGRPSEIAIRIDPKTGGITAHEDEGGPGDN